MYNFNIFDHQLIVLITLVEAKPTEQLEKNLVNELKSEKR